MRVILLAAFFVSVSFYAFAEDDVCADLTNFHSDRSKEISSIFTRGIMDDSAHRETNRQLQIANQYLLQLMALYHMQAHDCILPTTITTGLDYLSDALKCDRALLAGDGAKAPECDRSQWTTED